MQNINDLLKKNSLEHFRYFDDEPRIVYMRDNGTATQVSDYHKLINLLKANKIKHEGIGLDVVMILQ
jgi:hypothetical protein